MSQLGMSTMIGMLFDDGSSTANAVEASLGKTIQKVTLDADGNGGNGELHFIFDDDSELRIFDSGQSCCETRYMHTDDDLSYYTDCKFTNIDVKPVAEIEDEENYEYHESQFLHIQTSKGVFTVSTHNIHNGYYGGFWLQATLDEGTD